MLKEYVFCFNGFISSLLKTAQLIVKSQPNRKVVFVNKVKKILGALERYYLYIFSLELGKDYFLHIPIIDNDGDQIQCAISAYLEAEGFGSFLTNLKKANALSMDKYVSY